MKTKIMVRYLNGNEECVYEGDFNTYAMRLQSKWVLKAKKDNNIVAVFWK